MAIDPQHERFGSDLSNDHRNVETAAPYRPPAGSQQDSSNKGCGCWVWGCGGLMLIAFMLVVAVSFGGYWLFNQQVEKYTDTEPTEMPIVEMDEQELARLQERVESFSRRFVPQDSDESADEQPQPDADAADQPLTLALTADEINALIQTNEVVKDRVYVVIKDGRVKAQISIPTDEIPGMSGRYLNADVELEVSLEDGDLVVKIVDANVKGEPLPKAFLEGLSEENLAKEVSKNPDLSKSLEPFEKIEIIDNAIHLQLKPIDEPKDEPVTAEAPPMPIDVPAEQQPLLTP